MIFNNMRRPLVEIYRGGEVDLVDDYAPGFREAEEQGNGLAIGYDYLVTKSGQTHGSSSKISLGSASSSRYWYITCDSM
jgi:hypothetical protein